MSSSASPTTTDFGPLVSPQWLRAHLGLGGLRLLDIRWYLDDRSGRLAYLDGHIPGAVFVDLDHITGELTTHSGRHPLPSAGRFGQAMRAAGVQSGNRVVIYDDAGGSVAARLWWLLRHFGHSPAAVLDGGLQAWCEPLEAGEVTPATGDFTAGETGAGQVVTVDQVASRGARDVLLDARAPERFRGELEPIDPKAGHIPGARNAFWEEHLGPERRLLSADRLRERFRNLGVTSGDQVVAYCGSGVTACQLLLALEVAGLPGGRLYAGSWSQWCSLPEAPIATGD